MGEVLAPARLHEPFRHVEDLRPRAASHDRRGHAASVRRLLTTYLLVSKPGAGRTRPAKATSAIEKGRRSHVELADHLHRPSRSGPRPRSSVLPGQARPRADHGEAGHAGLLRALRLSLPA